LARRNALWAGPPPLLAPALELPPLAVLVVPPVPFDLPPVLVPPVLVPPVLVPPVLVPPVLVPPVLVPPVLVPPVLVEPPSALLAPPVLAAAPPLAVEPGPLSPADVQASRPVAKVSVSIPTRVWRMHSAG
jgi:hypothetical protein